MIPSHAYAECAHCGRRATIIVGPLFNLPDGWEGCARCATQVVGRLMETPASPEATREAGATTGAGDPGAYGSKRS